MRDAIFMQHSAFSIVIVDFVCDILAFYVLCQSEQNKYFAWNCHWLLITDIMLVILKCSTATWLCLLVMG